MDLSAHNNEHIVRRGLVLGAGGAKGSFQAGALMALRDLGKDDIDFVAGNSVGAINAAFVATDQVDAMIDFWKGVKRKHVFRLPSAKRLIQVMRGKQRGLADRAPFESLLREYLGSPLDLKCEFYCSAVSLLDGRPIRYSYPTIQALMASSAFPGMFDPVAANGDWHEDALVDGGLHAISPISAAFNKDITELIVVNCNPSGVTRSDIPTHAMDIMLRSMGILMQDSLSTDLKRVENINRLMMDIAEHAQEAGHDPMILRHKSGRPYRYLKPIVIEPSHRVGTTFSFHRAHLDASIQHGYDQTIKAFSDLSNT